MSITFADEPDKATKLFMQHVEEVRIKSKYARILLNKLLNETEVNKQKKIEIRIIEVLNEVDIDIINLKIEKAVEEL